MNVIRPDFFYLLDYVTQPEIFQIGEIKIKLIKNKNKNWKYKISNGIVIF